MAQLKLTERAVAQMKAPAASGKQTLYWDTELRGFGVLVSGTSNAKTYIVQRRLPTGQQRRVTIDFTNVVDLAQARSEAESLLHDLRLGRDPKAAQRGAMTLRQTLNDYLAARKSLRDKSRTGYRKAIENYLSDWLDFRIGDITPEMVERRHAAIQAGVKQRATERATQNAKKSGKSPEGIPTGYCNRRTIEYNGHATANGAMVALRALWNFAADRDPTLPPTNPVRRLRKSWFEVNRRNSRVSNDQLPTFYESLCSISNSTVRDYLLLLLFTGMRKGEAGSLLWEDIDFAAELIRVRASETKSKRKFDLPMNEFVRALLVSRRSSGIDGPFVFPANSRSGHIEEPRFALREIGRITGIFVSPHDLRRTFLDVAEATEMSVYALKALVNHSAGNDVTAGYLGLSTERLRAPAQKVADRMIQLCQIERLERYTINLGELKVVQPGHAAF